VPAAISHTIWSIIDLDKSKSELKAPERGGTKSLWLSEIWNEVSNLMILLSSAINIVPYYLLGRRFRTEFIQVFCCLCANKLLGSAGGNKSDQHGSANRVAFSGDTLTMLYMMNGSAVMRGKQNSDEVTSFTNLNQLRRHSHRLSLAQELSLISKEKRGAKFTFDALKRLLKPQRRNSPVGFIPSRTRYSLCPTVQGCESDHCFAVRLKAKTPRNKPSNEHSSLDNADTNSQKSKNLSRRISFFITQRSMEYDTDSTLPQNKSINHLHQITEFSSSTEANQFDIPQHL
ncbi:hypothetical protein Ciccas_014117, partial [Cichlidogyrus casuarinus]